MRSTMRLCVEKWENIATRLGAKCRYSLSEVARHDSLQMIDYPVMNRRRIDFTSEQRVKNRIEFGEVLSL